MTIKNSSMINGSVNGGGGNDNDPPPRPPLPLPLPLPVGVRDVEAMTMDQVYVNEEERGRNEEDRGRTY
jgi:hypothetical protein